MAHADTHNLYGGATHKRTMSRNTKDKRPGVLKNLEHLKKNRTCRPKSLKAC